MPSNSIDDSDAFAESACRLIIDFTDRLSRQKLEVVKIVDKYHASGRTADYLVNRYRSEMREFSNSRVTFSKLIRKCSQWLEHAKQPKPQLELELEIRLSDFENTVFAMDDFFNSNHI